MHDTAPSRERTLLIGAPRKRTREVKVIGDHLDELARLVDTAGATIAGRVIQAVERPTNDFYIGKGKVQEVAAMVADAGATMVVFDDELSPAQGKNLEEELKVRIMDRTEVILDIFALRAKSAEARMQVELAQLEYMLPRLARMWTHLSRIRGGIGLRGPGETQIETDRRMIRLKISQLKKKLADVAAHRERVRTRTRERGVPRSRRRWCSKSWPRPGCPTTSASSSSSTRPTSSTMRIGRTGCGWRRRGAGTRCSSVRPQGKVWTRSSGVWPDISPPPL